MYIKGSYIVCGLAHHHPPVGVKGIGEDTQDTQPNGQEKRSRVITQYDTRI